MKNYLLTAMILSCVYYNSAAQTDKNYPVPEFSNEVTLLKKDNTLIRLEKGTSSLEIKTKMAGFGGSESGYSMDGEKSTIRLTDANNLSFVLAASSSTHSPLLTDSALKANGIDPASYKEMTSSANDPSTKITLYKLDIEKGKRKIYLQKGGGIANKKIQTSDKYTFSVKKIRDGYWVFVVDKTLPKGEYAFSMMDMTGGAGAMGVWLFAFGVD
jgi:hypothetical protein